MELIRKNCEDCSTSHEERRRMSGRLMRCPPAKGLLGALHLLISGFWLGGMCEERSESMRVTSRWWFWKPALEIYKPDVTISNTLNLVFILYSFILVFRSILTPDIYLAFSNWLLSGLFLSKSYDYVWWLMSLTLLSVCVRHWFCCEVSLPLLKNVKLQK